MSSGTGKTVCCCIISKIPRLKFIFLSLVSGIGKDGNSAVFQNFLCNPRCFVSGIHRYKLNFGKTVRYLVVYCVPCSTIAYISSGYFNTQHKAVLITGCMCFVRKLPLMCPFTNIPQSGSVLDTVFSTVPPPELPLFSSSSSSLTFLPSFSRSSDTSLRSCSSYTFAALATCSFWNFFFIRGCFNMCSVDKNHAWVYHPVVQCFVQNMCKNFFTQLRGKRLQKA